jgi:hypothetical protein
VDLWIGETTETLIEKGIEEDIEQKKKTRPVLDPAWIRIDFTIELK